MVAISEHGKLISSPWRHRDLLITMIKREVIGRYRGSVMGILWSFLNPATMLLVYIFVFSVVFKARWSGGTDSRIEFALIVFAGLLVFNLFSECITRAPALVVSNVNYVKKVVFPLEILPWVTMGAALFHALFSLLVWLVCYMIFFGLPHMTLLLFPLVLLPLVLFTLGISWLLASLGVYLRDISQVVAVLTPALMFLSAIFYPVSALPAAYQPLLYLNPLTYVIEQARDVLFWGTVPSIPIWIGSLFASATVAWLGFVWFQKTRKGFADVL
jgi:lipopolysaccharide transport system permease protein